MKLQNGLKVKVNSLSHDQLFVTPWTVAHQAPPSMGFSRQEYWSGLPFPSPGDLPDPGIKPKSPSLWADALTSEPPGETEKKSTQDERPPDLLLRLDRCQWICKLGVNWSPSFPPRNYFIVCLHFWNPKAKKEPKLESLLNNLPWVHKPLLPTLYVKAAPF